MRVIRILLGLTFVMACSLTAQDVRVPPEGSHFRGPRTSADFPTWLADMKRWRVEYLKRIGYNGAEYDRPELKWIATSGAQANSMTRRFGLRTLGIL